MRHFLIILFIFLFSFTYISCSSDSSSSTTTDNSSSNEFLVGTWKTSCLTQSDNTSRVYTLVFTNSERNWQRQDYLNYDCSKFSPITSIMSGTKISILNPQSANTILQLQLC